MACGFTFPDFRVRPARYLCREASVLRWRVQQGLLDISRFRRIQLRKILLHRTGVRKGMDRSPRVRAQIDGFLHRFSRSGSQQLRSFGCVLERCSSGAKPGLPKARRGNFDYYFFDYYFKDTPAEAHLPTCGRPQVSIVLRCRHLVLVGCGA